MTEHDFVRPYFPSADARTARDILWECTAWPMCGIDGARKQLIELTSKANDPGQAFYISYGEADAAWNEYQTAVREGGGS